MNKEEFSELLNSV